MIAVTERPEHSTFAVWHAAISGLCAMLVGVGLARFAFSPLIPALVSAGWFTTSQAAYLDAANLAGYLGGALFAAHLQRYARPGVILRAAMALTGISFIACTIPELGFVWASAWRFVSGCTGAVVVVFAAPTVLAITPERLRGMVTGVMFAGLGLGAVASATVMPALLSAWRH